MRNMRARAGLVPAAAVLVALGALAQDAPRTSYPTRILCRACAATDAASARIASWRTVFGQRVDVLEPWLAHVSGGKPIFLQTPRTSLAVVSDGGKADAISEGELYYLRTVFKSLAAAPATLDAHETAHLLAIRLLKLEHEMVDALDLDAYGRLKREETPDHPTPADNVQVFVFSSKPAYEAFTSFRFDRDVWPLAGAMVDGSPTCAMLLPNLKDASAIRTFAFGCVLQLARGLSRAGDGLQPWLQVGLAHHFEDRFADKSQPAPPAATFPPGMEGPKDWGAFVADMITGGKVGDLGALCSTPQAALSVRSRLQSWSMVTWMLDKDRKAFAAMVRKLAHAPLAETPQKALLAAVRATLNHDLVSLVDAWADAFKKSRSTAGR
jgi:hypothetical protein